MKGLPMPEPRLMCSICSFQPKKKKSRGLKKRKPLCLSLHLMEISLFKSAFRLDCILLILLDLLRSALLSFPFPSCACHCHIWKDYIGASEEDAPIADNEKGLQRKQTPAWAYIRCLRFLGRAAIAISHYPVGIPAQLQHGIWWWNCKSISAVPDSQFGDDEKGYLHFNLCSCSICSCQKKNQTKKRTEENKTHMPEPEPTFDGNCSL